MIPCWTVPCLFCLFALLGMFKMFDIPMGARHIVIEENETSPHIIGELFSQSFFQPQNMSPAFQAGFFFVSQTINYLEFGTTCLGFFFFFFTSLNDFWDPFKRHLHDPEHIFSWSRVILMLENIILWNIYILGINLSLLGVVDSCEKGLLVQVN